MKKSSPEFQFSPQDTMLAHTLSAEDFCSLLVGRLVSSFSHIDQWLYDAIDRLQFRLRELVMICGTESTEAHEEAHPKFDNRKKQLRRLIVVSTDANAKLLSEWDRLEKEISNLSLVRHHLAHGAWYFLVTEELGPHLIVMERLQRTKHMKKTRYMPINNLDEWQEMNKGLLPRYTLQQIAAARESVEELRFRLDDFCSQAARQIEMRIREQSPFPPGSAPAH